MRPTGAIPTFKLRDVEGVRGPLKTGLGGFVLVVESYATVGIASLSGVDYLGQSTRPQTPGATGGTNEVILRFQANHRGRASIVLTESGTSYETSLPVDEREITVNVHIC